jgi:hypothetical protein
VTHRPGAVAPADPAAGGEQPGEQVGLLVVEPERRVEPADPQERVGSNREERADRIAQRRPASNGRGFATHRGERAGPSVRQHRGRTTGTAIIRTHPKSERVNIGGRLREKFRQHFLGVIGDGHVTVHDEDPVGSPDLFGLVVERVPDGEIDGGAIADVAVALVDAHAFRGVVV